MGIDIIGVIVHIHDDIIECIVIVDAIIGDINITREPNDEGEGINSGFFENET